MLEKVIVKAEHRVKITMQRTFGRLLANAEVGIVEQVNASLQTKLSQAFTELEIEQEERQELEQKIKARNS